MKETGQIKEKLIARERDLENLLNRQDSNARDAGDADVQDEIDRVTTDEAKSAALEISTREFQSLRDVRDALSRIEAGDYGHCTICGKEIETSRLAAIPETPFCLEHADSERTTSTEEGSIRTS